MPFSDESFAGVIFTLNTISEILPTLFALSEAKRVLKNNGQIYIFVQSNQNNLHIFSPLKSGLTIDGVDNYTYFIDRLPTKKYGPYSFQTQLNVRTQNTDELFIYEQYLPSDQVWEQLFDNLELSVTNKWGGFNFEPFTKNSPVLIYTIQKQNSSHIGNQMFLNQAYDKIAKDYDAFAKMGDYSIPDWLKLNFQKFQNKHPRILDLGCANGLLIKLLNEMNVYPKAYGIDYSKAMVVEAKKTNLYQAVSQVDLSNGIPIVEENLYDMILSFGITEFIKNINPFLTDCNRILRRSGKLFISFELKDTQLNEMRLSMTPEVEYFNYQEQEILDLLSQSSFKVQSSTKQIGYISPSTKQPVNYMLIEAEKV